MRTYSPDRTSKQAESISRPHGFGGGRRQRTRGPAWQMSTRSEQSDRQDRQEPACIEE